MWSQWKATDKGVVNGAFGRRHNDFSLLIVVSKMSGGEAHQHNATRLQQSVSPSLVGWSPNVKGDRVELGTQPKLGALRLPEHVRE